jgi:uncharacterized membrane protein YbjE (DUF340 family)
MTLLILFVILIGALLGHFILPIELIEEVDLFITIALNLMIFSVGIGIGHNKKILSDLKRMGLRFLFIPLGTIIGSLIGGIVAGLFLQMSIWNRLAIASGFGYYSLSSTLLFKLEGVEVGTIAFLTNVSREVLAIILIPFLAKYISGYTSVSIAGATSMDTTLPLIKEFTNDKIALVSFVHGAVLSILVPFLVNFFASLS